MEVDGARALWESAVGDGAAGADRFDAVVAGYAEPHRRYHDIAHLTGVLQAVVDLCATEPVTDRQAVVAAAFYHDVVYDPLAKDNEERSAVRAEAELIALGWAHDRARRVADMVRATVSHTAADRDTAILLDADLSVLGADPAGYAGYVSAVRAEYAAVDEPTWRHGRAAVLRGLLAHDHLYATETGRQRWESAARRNLADELHQLRRGVTGS